MINLIVLILFSIMQSVVFRVSFLPHSFRGRIHTQIATQNVIVRNVMCCVW